eukprot:CAMPEP_0185760688 /NCGR_PEP_ID=MMETSP1174-20130828/19597_1 /TAXON_ID=35687 /ORGANISM="Dictyocha speculum, Strain CCMP1381" /LENGTH=140 /DNA_ID=CAMNT_0028441605 /DNA_START=8 /DNA_END=430 /DNA_ORIENTATION=-
MLRPIPRQPSPDLTQSTWAQGVLSGGTAPFLLVTLLLALACAAILVVTPNVPRNDVASEHHHRGLEESQCIGDNVIREFDDSDAIMMTSEDTEQPPSCMINVLERSIEEEDAIEAAPSFGMMMVDASALHSESTYNPKLD